MKKLILFSIFITLLSCRNDDDSTITKPEETLLQQPYQTAYTLSDSQKFIFEESALPEIKMEIPLSEWNKLLSYFDQNPNNEEYVSGKYTFSKNGSTEILENVGIRLRGNTSRRRPEGNTGQSHSSTNPDWNHTSFTVNFKNYNKSQLFHSSEKLILKWFNNDPMYVREVYSYDLFERFGVWTAPQSSYCKLTIHVEGDAKSVYYGVYQMIEPVDDIYLSNRNIFFSTTGNLWKANWGASLKDASTANMGIENVTLTSNYTPVYDYKGSKSNLETAKTQLVDFINNINSKSGDDFKTYISQKMDVNLFLKTYAVNVVVGMWDDYWNNSNNYYFYFDSAGKFYFIPYDYDNTLGTSYLMNDSGIQNPLTWGKDTNNPLVAKILSIAEYKAQYIKYLNDLVDKKYDLFYVDYSQQRIQNWQNKISSYISNDTGEDMTINDAPAYWGNCGFYKLRGNSTANNYFIRKTSSIPSN